MESMNFTNQFLLACFLLGVSVGTISYLLCKTIDELALLNFRDYLALARKHGIYNVFLKFKLPSSSMLENDTLVKDISELIKNNCLGHAIKNVEIEIINMILRKEDYRERVRIAATSDGYTGYYISPGISIRGFRYQFLSQYDIVNYLNSNFDLKNEDISVRFEAVGDYPFHDCMNIKITYNK